MDSDFAAFQHDAVYVFREGEAVVLEIKGPRMYANAHELVFKGGIFKGLKKHYKNTLAQLRGRRATVREKSLQKVGERGTTNKHEWTRIAV